MAVFSHFAFSEFSILKTGYAYDPRCTTYAHSPLHSESPQRVKWIHNRLKEINILEQVSTVEKLADPMPHIRKVHTEEHIQGIHSIPRDSSATEKIGPIADLAAALVLGAVKGVCEGRLKNAFCNIRPPGHHVMNSGNTSGFCAYANVVIAARFAQEVMNHQRVLIIDWDFHHGNGTVHFVCNDTNVMFFEVGCENCADEICNKQRLHIITKGVENESGNEEYISVWREHLLPAAENFKPDLVLISCGFDLKNYDCLGYYEITAHGISRLSRLAMDIADKHCNGKMVSMLEGGYCDQNSQGHYTWFGLAQCAENHMKTLITGTIQPETPFFLIPGGIKFKNGRPGRFKFMDHRMLFLGPGVYLQGARIFDLRGRALMESGLPNFLQIETSYSKWGIF